MGSKKLILAIVIVMLEFAAAVEREITVHVDAGKEECFFETVIKGNTLTVEYQVIDGGSTQMAELDINFRIINPRGQPLIAEFKKSDGAHSQRVEVCGLSTYFNDVITRVCF